MKFGLFNAIMLVKLKVWSLRTERIYFCNMIRLWSCVVWVSESYHQ